MRDRAEADLPYYTTWLARVEHPAPGAMDSVITTWRDLHTLNKLLLDQSPKSIQLEDGGRLGELTRQIKKNVGDIQKAFDSKLDSLMAAKAGLAEVQRDIDVYLTLPIIGADKRGDLLNADLRVRQALDENANNKTIPGENAQNELAWAVRRGSLDAALLGLSPPEISLQPDRQKLRDAGEKIGIAWRDRAKVIREKFESAKQATTVVKSLPALRLADQLCRLVDGAAAVDNTPMPPERAFEQAELNGLLLWQAQRTVDDHWWSVDQTPEPYFVVAARKYAKDAEELAIIDKDDSKTKTLRTADADKLVKSLRGDPVRVARIDPNSLVDPKAQPLPRELTITSEGQFRLAYRLDRNSIPPDGVPMVWLAPPAKDSGVAVKKQSFLERQPAPASKFPLEPYELVPKNIKSGDDLAVSDLDDAPRSELVFNTFFRGQLIPTKTTLIFYSHPDMIAYDAPPRDTKAQIAAWADQNVAEGTIEIVLDASGSMLFPQDHQITPAEQAAIESRYDAHYPCKYHKATEALAAVLRSIPPRMKVGIVMFGAKDQTDWVPAELFGEPQTLTPGKIDRWMKEVNEKEPFGHSPIFDAMLKAKERLRGEPGLRTIFVLTDGDDNKYDAATIRTGILKEFQTRDEDSDILVSMLLFQSKDPKERERATKQFKEMITSLKNGRGLWLDTEELFGGKDFDALAIVDHVKRAMLPRLRLIRNSRARAQQPVYFLPEKPQNRINPDWTNPALDPGGYEAVLYKGRSTFLDLKPAERMIVHLRRTDVFDASSDVIFTREIIGNLLENSSKPRYPTRTMPDSDWLTTVLYSSFPHHGTSGFLDMRVAVESMDNKPFDGTLSQKQPRQLWMEVKPANAADGETPMVCWGKRKNYEAPAWDIFAPTWPRDSSHPQKRTGADLEVWWTDPAADLASVSARYDPKVSKDLNRLAGSCGQGITIESVTEEEQAVVVGKVEGNVPVQQLRKDCLVVRLRYTGHDPVLVSLPGLEVEGSEHKFYRKAQKVTAIFWGGAVGPSLRDRKFELQLLPVDQLKHKGPGFHDAKPGANEGGVEIHDPTS